MVDVKKFNGGGTRLTSESFNKFLRKNAERFEEKTDQIEALADLFSLALAQPEKDQENYFREILEEAHRQKISDLVVQTAFSIALEKRYPRRTDLRRKTRCSVENLLTGTDS